MSELNNVSKISFGNKFFNLYSISVTLDILFAIIIAWFFHDKVSSSNMPRKLNECTRSICMFVINGNIYIFYFGFYFLWNTINFVLFVFKDNLFSFSHKLTIFNSMLISVCI